MSAPGAPRRFTAAIVDDEPLARERIRTLLAQDPEVSILHECATGALAIECVKRKAPDILFLDIQMPEVDGFGVLRGVAPVRISAIVFVTAYDQYALQAFDYLALDYLLKPFHKARFFKTLARAKRQAEAALGDQLRDQIGSLLSHMGRTHLERLAIREASRITFVSVSDIRFLEAQGNYVKVHTGDGGHLVRRSLTALAAALDPSRFLRIHRSTVVNLDFVRELRPMFHGEYLVALKDGTELPTGRGFRETLRRFLPETF